jgi:hypothetical protein
MTNLQINDFQRSRKLILQLEAYGLNPNDWRVDSDQTEPGVLRVRHRHDSDFMLRGFLSRTRKGVMKLENLQVASL